MPNYLPNGYEYKTYRRTDDAPPSPHMPPPTGAFGIIEQERGELIAAERAIDPDDRATVELALKWGAAELRIPVPRVRFFTKTSAFDFDGLVYRAYPDEIWVNAGRPWFEQVRLGLHELAHTAQLDGGDHGHDSRERDATEFARKHMSWAHEAARCIASGGTP